MKHTFLSIFMLLVSVLAVGQTQKFTPKVYFSLPDNEILYSNYDNRVDISVPGVSDDKISVECENAVVSKKNGIWIVTPKADSNKCQISVYATVNGKKTSMGNHMYRVKRLPAPTAYLVSKGREYMTDRNVARQILLDESAYIEAGYGEDGILNAGFKITSFSLRCGHRIIRNEGCKFSQEQLEELSRLRIGTCVVITDIIAT